jgi:hypothetical protein
VIFFYVDEAGDPNPYHVPLLSGETPMFCLSAVAIDSTQWRELDRSLLALKRTYFSPELTKFRAANPTMWDRHYEVKGRDLMRPSHAKRRTKNFTNRVLQLAQTLNAPLFCVAWAKQPSPGDPIAIYTHALQILAERFHHYARSRNDEGVIVVDKRTHNIDFRVGNSHLSFLLGNPVGRTYVTLTEAPMFADSQLSPGIQFADLLGGLLYGIFYRRRCAAIPGAFDGVNQLTPERLANAAGPWTIRAPARDYSHCQQFWGALDALQFRRADIAAPVPGGHFVAGYYGFREIDSKPAPIAV